MAEHATIRPVRPPRADALLTLDEAAAYLKIAPGTLKHWAAWKRIEHVKLGRLIRFRQSALDAFVTAQTVAAVDRDE